MIAPHENAHVLGLAPSKAGCGYAIFGWARLLDWGLMNATGDKNAWCLERAAHLIRKYRPCKIILEDYWSEGSRRAPRIRILGRQIVELAKAQHVKVRLFDRKHLYAQFLVGKKGTKHDLAEVIASRFPEELASRLPPKRRAWMSEDRRYAIFDAVAFALAGSYRPVQN